MGIMGVGRKALDTEAKNSQIGKVNSWNEKVLNRVFSNCILWNYKHIQGTQD